MRKILISFLSIFFLVNIVGFVVSPNLVFAQEVEYPEVPGVPTPGVKTGLPDYVKYIFYFAIWASGLIALCVLIYGGFKYLTSSGNIDRTRDAKEQITAALLGLIILFSSYLILVKINPQLVIFHLPTIPPPVSTLRPGVLVCKEPEPPDIPANVIQAWDLIQYIQKPDTPIEDKVWAKEELDKIMKTISKYCYHIEGGGDVWKDFDNKIKYVYLIPKEEEEDILGPKYTNYGAILYEDKGFGDKAKVIISFKVTGEPFEEIINMGEIKISSIRPFVLVKPEADHKAILYEKIDYNIGGTVPGGTFSLVLNTCSSAFGFIPQSIEIKGDYLVILYEEPGVEEESEVFIKPGDPDLNNNRVACWQTCTWYGVPYPCKRSCVTASCTYGAKLY